MNASKLLNKVKKCDFVTNCMIKIGLFQPYNGVLPVIDRVKLTMVDFLSDKSWCSYHGLVWYR